MRLFEPLENRVLLDGLAPVATIESPADGAKINPGDTINLQGLATDPDGTIADHAWFILGPGPGEGGLPIFIKTYAIEDPGDLVLPNVGYYTIIYGVKDNNGNPDATPAQISVTVGEPTNPPPDGTITSPLNGTVISAGGSVNLASTATDPNGVVIMHAWTGFGPGGYVADPMEDSRFLLQNPGNVRLDAPGEYFFGYIAIDNGFQPDPSPATISVTVLPNELPNGTITFPTEGAVLDAGSQYTLVGTGSDPDGSVQGWSWQVNGPGGFVWTSTEQSPTTPPLMSAGAYTFSLTVSDDKGAADPSPAVVNTTVIITGNLPPDGVIESPLNNTTIVQGGLINMQGRGTDLDGVIAQWAWAITGPGGFSWNSNVEDPGALALSNTGVYTVSLIVTDDDGRADPIPAQATVTVVAANDPPNGTIESPAGGTVIEAGGTIDPLANGSDPDGTITAWNWEITGPEGFVWTSTIRDPLPIILDTPGSYIATLTVVDNLGMADPTPAISNITVLGPQNLAPNATIDSPADGTTIPVNGTIDLQGTGVDSDGTIASYQWIIVGPGPGVGGLPVFVSQYSSEDPGILRLPNAGEYMILFTVTDDDGATDPTPAQITVTAGASGNQSPVGVIDTPADGTRIQPGESIFLSAHATDRDGAIVMHTWFGFGPDFTFDPQSNPDALKEDPGSIVLTEPGQYYFTYVPIDNKFQPDPDPDFIMVIVEEFQPNRAPEGTILSPLDGTTIQPGQNVDLQADGYDLDGRIVGWLWQISGPNGYSNVISQEDPGALTLVDPGQYTFRLTVFDDDGAADATPSIAHVTVGDVVLNNPPEAFIDSPLVGAAIAPGGAVNLAGRGFDGDGSVVGWQWTVTGPGFFNRTFSVEDPGDLILPSVGYYTIMFNVVDDDGDIDPTPAMVSVKVGEPTNKPPDGRIDSPTDGTIIQPGGTIILAGSWSDLDGATATHQWIISGPNGYSWTSTLEDPGPLVLANQGVYSVVYIVRDGFFQPDVSPAVATVTVRELPGPRMLGRVQTTAGDVYVYDADGVGIGLPIDGDYENYDPNSPYNDLIIVGTPNGVMIATRSQTWFGPYEGYKQTDFTGLGIAVKGRIGAFVDNRIGTGPISFIAATSGMGAVIINSTLAGLAGASFAPQDPPFSAGMIIPVGTGLYTKSGGIEAAIIRGVDASGDSLLSDVVCEGMRKSDGIGALIINGNAVGDVMVQSSIGNYAVSGNLAGDVSAGTWIGAISAAPKWVKNPAKEWVLTGGNILGGVEAGAWIGSVSAIGRWMQASDGSLSFVGGDMNGSVEAGKIIYQALGMNNVSGHIEAQEGIGAVVAHNKLLGSDSIITPGFLNLAFAGMGADVAIEAGSLGALVVQRGNFEGSIEAGSIAQIAIPDGNMSASVIVENDVAQIKVARTFQGTLAAGGKIHNAWFGNLAGLGFQRTRIIADDGIGTLAVLGNVADADIGVGVRGIEVGRQVSLGMLYIGGNFERANVLAGVWNEPEGTASASNPFSDGGETMAFSVPAISVGDARIERVYIGGRIGTSGAPAAQWAIASKNPPRGGWLLLDEPDADVVVNKAVVPPPPED